MSTFMRKLGCHYETALNGLVALEKYGHANRQFDFVLMGKFPTYSESFQWDALLIVSDISMPVMDGLTATIKIREHERDTGLNPARVLAITAVASNATQEAALKAGANDYIVKPLSLGKLRELMHLL